MIQDRSAALSSTSGLWQKHLIQVETSRLTLQLWREAGRPAGRLMHYWTVAEKQLRAAGNSDLPKAEADAAAALTARTGKAQADPLAAEGHRRV